MSIKIYPGFYKAPVKSNNENTGALMEVFKPYDLGNTIIVGKTGTGRFAVFGNILSQFLLCYNDKDIRLRIWDGAGELIPGKSSGIEFCDIVEVGVNSAECTLLSFLQNVRENIIKRLHNEIDKSIPQIVILNDMFKTFYLLSDYLRTSIIMLMQQIVSHSCESNVYLYIVSDSINFVQSPLCLEDFDIVIVTKVDNDESVRIFGDTRVSKDKTIFYKRNTIVHVKYGDSVRVLNTPFYNKPKVIRDILSRETLPKGVRFTDYGLKQWENFARLICKID